MLFVSSRSTEDREGGSRPSALGTCSPKGFVPLEKETHFGVCLGSLARLLLHHCQGWSGERGAQLEGLLTSQLPALSARPGSRG